MDVMIRKLFYALLVLLLISGCATTADTESQTQETQAPPMTVAERQADMAQPGLSSESRRDQKNQPEPLANKTLDSASKIPSKDDIRLLQVRMKGLGFDPGLSDGVIGPKTKTALQQFQLACTVLRELWDIAETENFWKTADARGSKLRATANQTSTNKDDVRLLQTRMKAAGLDPGPIDGIMGVKTRSQLLAAQSGCSMLKTFPAITDQDLQTPGKQSPALVSPKKPSQPVTSSSTASAAPVNKKSGPESISRKAWLAPMSSN
jgi:peptidoglycan hydrolase-like protein with peptidoglycan-binding domain